MNNVLILGGSGFVGRHLCEHLVRQGIRATVPTRRESHAQALQTLPGVTVVEANVHDEAALRGLLPGHDAVVNLVAILHGNAHSFQQAHVALPQTLARAMQATGVRRLVHISALGAGEQAVSLYQRSKTEGEAVLRATDLDLTLLRPSVIFGAEDRFLNMFARLQAGLPLMLLAGGSCRFQPVWVGDVAEAIVRCLLRPETAGQTYECVGPQVLTLADLVRLAGQLSGHPRPVLSLPLAFGVFQALLLKCLPGPTVMSVDNVHSMQVDNVASGALPTLAALGIAPEAVTPVAARYLARDHRADPLLALRRHPPST
ncbi:MAG TPA: complex I NDUFA9 subunit family protein [Macromonas sp.]|nr:complex I NDUFA9 subunit family protein [Macromonas sp.]